MRKSWAFPSCVCLEFSRKQKVCVTCSQSPAFRHFAPADVLPSGKPSVPGSSAPTGMLGDPRQDNDTSVISWGPMFSPQFPELFLLACTSWTVMVLAALAKACPWPCWSGPGLCYPGTFHVLISAVYCLRSSQGATCLLIPSVDCFVSRLESMSSPGVQLFQKKFSQQRNRPEAIHSGLLLPF